MSNWTCPYCNHSQISGQENRDREGGTLMIGNIDKCKYYQVIALRCLNTSCMEISLSFHLFKYSTTVGTDKGEFIQSWSLWPESISKPQPDCIPEPLKADYYEACLIRDKSPKASATLARRCLQGMIRDFCKISKATLNQEIQALSKLVDEDTAPKGVSVESVEGIDAVRSIGNIGAHMEKDINVIVDVDPGEAQVLIDLIEMLFEEWYVARQKREERFAAVKALAREKKAQIDAAKPKP